MLTPAKSSRQLGALQSVDLLVVFINIALQIQESLGANAVRRAFCYSGEFASTTIYTRPP